MICARSGAGRLSETPKPMLSWTVSQGKTPPSWKMKMRRGSGPSCQSLRQNVRIVLQDIASPLIMDRFAPPSKHKSCLRDPDEEVAQGCRVKNVGVEDGN